MSRPGVARHHQRRAREQRHEVRRATSRGASSAAPPTRRRRARASALLARAPGARPSAGRAIVRSAAATAPKRSGGHRLFGQPAPGFRQRDAAARLARSLAAAAQRQPNLVRTSTPTARTQREVLRDDVSRRCLASTSLRVEHAGHRLAQRARDEPDDASRAGAAAQASPISAAPENRARRRSRSRRSRARRRVASPPRAAVSISIGRTSASAKRSRTRPVACAPPASRSSAPGRGRRDRGHRGHGVHDVAERAQTDDQHRSPGDPLAAGRGSSGLRDRRRWRCVRRTPATIARSGTVSTV